ncbi:MAG: hypothetical protein K0U54_08590, partial [Bacteroidetes bacterium]|nr:hypothetical protein [Bacteroidota bacterium]
VLIGLLSAMLIALAVYTVSLYNDSKNNITSLETQKTEIEGELQELIENYDEVIQENELKDNDLLSARERIEVLLDSVKTADANIGLIRRYKAEIGRLKDERKMLFRRADSLMQANQMLAVRMDSTNVILNETIRVVDSVGQENIAMAETIKKGSVVNATDLRGEGVIIRKSGKVVDTKRSSRADKVRTCFTLSTNIIAEKGDRLFFVQVFNPNNILLGEKATMEFEQGSLNYSATAKVFYEQDELDVCVLVNAAEEDLVEGRYTINVFDGAQQVATAAMDLK